MSNSINSIDSNGKYFWNWYHVPSLQFFLSTKCRPLNKYYHLTKSVSSNTSSSRDKRLTWKERKIEPFYLSWVTFSYFLVVSFNCIQIIIVIYMYYLFLTPKYINLTTHKLNSIFASSSLHVPWVISEVLVHVHCIAHVDPKLARIQCAFNFPTLQESFPVKVSYKFHYDFVKKCSNEWNV